ncbi:hypothetical protein KZC35_22625, partial [Salmonella enterica subsp. enterica serovar Javiana]|nr:hypothetical protein [Salmonella enterica subsp. enterica serovar Javiana]
APGEASSINLPGIRGTVGKMLETLRQAGGQAARDRVTHQRDECVEKIAASWAGRIDNQRALALGFVADKRFDDIIERFRQDDMEGRS